MVKTLSFLCTSGQTHTLLIPPRQAGCSHELLTHSSGCVAASPLGAGPIQWREIPGTSQATLTALDSMSYNWATLICTHAYTHTHSGTKKPFFHRVSYVFIVNINPPLLRQGKINYKWLPLCVSASCVVLNYRLLTRESEDEHLSYSSRAKVCRCVHCFK